MNVTYRFESQRNPDKEKEFCKAIIELARMHTEEEINQLIAKKRSNRQREIKAKA